MLTRTHNCANFLTPPINLLEVRPFEVLLRTECLCSRRNYEENTSRDRS